MSQSPIKIDLKCYDDLSYKMKVAAIVTETLKHKLNRWKKPLSPDRTAELRGRYLKKLFGDRRQRRLYYERRDRGACSRDLCRSHYS